MPVYLGARDYSTLAVPTQLFARHNAGMSVAHTIKAAMARKKLTQTQLAQMVGVEQPTVQRWCAGKREPEHENIPALAKALGLEPYDFLDLGMMRALGLVPANAQSDVGAEIVGIFAGLPADQRELLLEMATMIEKRSGRDEERK